MMKTRLLIILLTLTSALHANQGFQDALTNSFWSNHAEFNNFSMAMRQDGARQTSYEIGAGSPKYYGFDIETPESYGKDARYGYSILFEENMRIWAESITNITYLESGARGYGSRTKSDGFLFGLDYLNVNDNKFGLSIGNTQGKVRVDNGGPDVHQDAKMIGLYYRQLGDTVVFAEFEQGFNLCYGESQNKFYSDGLSPSWRTNSFLAEFRMLMHIVNNPTNGNIGTINFSYERTHQAAANKKLDLYAKDYESFKLEFWQGGSVEVIQQYRLYGTLGFQWDIYRTQTPKNGVSPGYAAFLLNAGSTYTFAENFDISLGYYLETRRRYQTQSIRLGLHHSF